MKFKRMASAVMAAAMAVTSSVVCEITANAEATIPVVNVKGNTNSWALNLNYSPEVTVTGTDTSYDITITNKATYGDTFSGGALAVNFFDPDNCGENYKVVSVTKADNSVIEINGTPTLNQYLWNGSTSVRGYEYAFTAEQLTSIGSIDIDESIVINVQAEYDDGSNDDVVWTGSTDLGTDWGTSVSVSAFNINENDKIKIYYTVGSADYHQLKIMDGDWNVLASSRKLPNVNDWDCITVSSDGVLKCVADSADAAAVTEKGLVISGYDATITKVAVVRGTVAVSGVTLDETKLSLEEGATATLTATVAPENATDKKVTWSSSAPSVATVDENGKVTAVKAGEAVITATAGEKTAECAVTVTPVPVKSVTIKTRSQTTFKVGDSVTLGASVNDDATIADKEIVWSSSDDTVATVDETTGKVNFKAEGEVTITAAYKSDITIKDTITLTATTKEIPVSKVTITAPEKTAYTVGDALTLKANVNSDANVADKKIVWSSSNESIATINENTGVVTFVSNGTVTFTASYKSDASISDSVTISVSAASYAESKTEYNKTATTPVKLNIKNPDEIVYVKAISEDEAKANNGVDVTVTADGKTFKKTIKTVYKQFKFEDTDGAKYIETGADGTYFVIIRIKGTSTVKNLSVIMNLVK